MSSSDIDRVLEKLEQDVEAAVQSLRREVADLSARARDEAIAITRAAGRTPETSRATPASRALEPPRLTPVPRVPETPRSTPVPRAPTPPSVAGSPRPTVAAPVLAGGAAGWTREEGEAVMKCITAWIPMGPPTAADPASRCIAAMKELVPTWEQRERAREAVRRISQP